jgi:hypothetical protein
VVRVEEHDAQAIVFAHAIDPHSVLKAKREKHIGQIVDCLQSAALDKSETLQRRLADYHKASPELAHWLARWQSEDAKA